MRVSIVIPCFNEAKTVEALVEAVRASEVPDKEIILVDDASTDSTWEIVTTKLAGRVDRVLRHERNRGKGAALRTGFAAATGDVVLANPNLTDMEVCYKAFRRDVLARIELEEDRFGFEPEITAKVAKLGVRIYEVGVLYSGRTYAEGKKIGWRDGVHAVWCLLKYNLLR